MEELFLGYFPVKRCNLLLVGVHSSVLGYAYRLNIQHSVKHLSAKQARVSSTFTRSNHERK